MEEKNRNMTDEQLSQQLRKSKGGNIVLIVLGGVVLALGQAMQSKSKEQASQQSFDAIAPVAGISGELIRV